LVWGKEKASAENVTKKQGKMASKGGEKSHHPKQAAGEKSVQGGGGGIANRAPTGRDGREVPANQAGGLGRK